MPIEHLPEKIDSKFRFVLLAAYRAEQIMRGAQPKVPTEESKITRVAMKEILDDEVAWDYGPEAIPEEDASAMEMEVFEDDAFGEPAESA